MNDSERTHPDVLAAIADARVLPEHLWNLRRSQERSTARRMVACRLLHVGWKPGRIARLMGVSGWQVRQWRKACLARFYGQAWRPPAGISDTPLGRKWRRVHGTASQNNPILPQTGRE